MRDELNYDSLQASQHSKPSQTSIPKPKVFSLTQSVNHRENFIAKSTGSRDRPPFSENPKAFRLFGGPGDQSAKRAPIFPALQRFQQSQNQQQLPKSQSTTPLLSLLKPPTPAPTSTPADVFHSQAHPPDSSPSHDPEPSSDKDLPLSPSPRSNMTHTTLLQMLPPRSPVALISRPDSRARSRSHSASFSNDDNAINVDITPDLSTPSKSKGLPNIAMIALREVQMVTDELAEQRRQTQSILDQLNALSSTHETLKSDHGLQQQDLVSVQRELDATKHALQDTSGRLAAANADKEKKQQELSEVLEQLGNVQIELKAEREEKKRKTNDLKERMLELDANYTQLNTSFHSLKISYDASQALLSEMRHARGWAADGLQSIEPLLDADNNYVRSGEVKALIGELQDELAGSQRVNDLLRDKLHYQSSQFAEVKDRVRELEEGEKGRLGDIVAILGGSRPHAEVGERGLAEKIREVVEKLVNHERETVEVCAEAAAAEAQSRALAERLEEVKRTLAKREKEVEELTGVQDANRILGTRIEELEALNMSMHQTAQELKVANNTIGARDSEILTLHKEIAELRNGKAEIQELVSQARATAKLAEENAKRVEKGLVEESCKLGKVQGRCEFLEAELGKVRKECDEAKKAALKSDLLEAELGKAKKEIAEREDTSRQAENKVMVLQERFDAQTIILRLAKEHSGDLQERLLVSENSFATKIAVLQERNAQLQRTVDSLKQDCAAKEAALVDAVAEFDKRMAKQEAASERLIEAETKRADVTEREAEDGRRQMKEERRVNSELKKRIGVMESARKQIEEEARRMVVDAEGVKDEQLIVLKEMVVELKSMNDELMEKAKTLRERYESNNLMDEEKDFVAWLLRLSQSLHEQEDVAKENELRRRENMINTLQARIQELESSLARLLHAKGKEDGGQSKSMVDLRMWMSSPYGSDYVLKATPSHGSPNTPRASQVLALALPVSAAAPSATIDPALLALPALASTVISVPDAVGSSKKPIPKSKISKIPGVNETETIPQATTSRATQKPKPIKTFATLCAEDSEDDTPLSELSDCFSVLGKRARAVSPVKVEKPRVTRRSRATTKTAETALQPSSPSVQMTMPVQSKTAEGNVKTKQKKRKA